MTLREEKMKIFIFLSCIIGVSFGYSVNPPPFMQACYRNDPQRDECIRNSIQNFLLGLQRNPNYYPDLKFEPLVYDSITINYSENFIKGWFKFENSKSYGLQNAKVLKVRSIFGDKDFKIQAILNHPRIQTNGDYSTSATLLTPLTFENQGSFNVTFTDVTAKWTIKGRVEHRNGEDYLTVDLFDVISDANGMKFAITGLASNELLTNFVVDAINENWKTFHQVLMPETRKQWNPVLRKLANRIIKDIPYRKISLI